MKTFLVNFISFYQRVFSPLKRSSCVFYPTCSEYAKEAISRYGALKGSALALGRILRCHPWQQNHIDPVQ